MHQLSSKGFSPLGILVIIITLSSPVFSQQASVASVSSAEVRLRLGPPPKAAPLDITQSEPVSPCVAGHTSTSTGFWKWPANSHVNIYLREPDFSAEYVSAVKIAVENWNAAAVEDGSNVYFDFHGLTIDTKTAQGDLTIVRGDVYDKKRHLAFLQAHSRLSNQLIDYALVIVDLKIKNPEVLTNVMAHELGHSLGLMDCYECNRKTTAMGLLKTANEPNGIEGPTPCDKVAVLAGYRELALQVRAATAGQLLVGEVAEPEADEQPVIRLPR